MAINTSTMRLSLTRTARPNLGASRRFGAPRHQHRRGFGRGRTWLPDQRQADDRPAVSDDLKLFASTFAAGFLFVSIVIG